MANKNKLIKNLFIFKKKGLNNSFKVYFFLEVVIDVEVR
jgi:hypothetical protein